MRDAGLWAVVALSLTVAVAAGSACADEVAAEDPCRSVTCINPPPPECDGDVKVSRSAIGQCVEVDGVALCDYGQPVRQSCVDLGKLCQDGQCVEEEVDPVVPCENVTCTTRPAPDCDGNVARIFAASGTCNPAIPPAGACEYAVTDTLDCELSGKSCRAGACVDPADFPCDPNPCDVPPQGTCAGSVPTEVAATGTCTAQDRTASCAYAPTTRAACPAGQSCYLGRCATGLAAPAAAGDLVIDEIMANPAAADDAGEWLELANPGTVARVLDGCVLKDDGADSHTITPGAGATVIVPPGGFVVLARSGDAADNGAGGLADYVYGADGGFTLANAADEVVLVCGGVEIDRVAYDTGAGWPAETGASLSLSPANTTAVANDARAAWCVAPAAYGTKVQKGSPRRANPACP
ncbi:MAG: lamin tail domain-containing protein [Myxococcales bacterium]|nr:lamin tail domain-containing protein [Myxococcales bacterium]MCB9731238.1 lamin tail domain-containing protein [Deltaproteobacteria bacterium]